MADEEVRISLSLQDDISTALSRAEGQVTNLGDAAAEAGRQGERGGEKFAEGMDKAAESAEDVARESRRARRPVEKLGDEAAKAGGKAAAGATGLDRFAAAARRVQRNAGGMSTVMRGLRFAGITTAVFALAGGLSALAAGAVIATGAISPMVGAIAAALPIVAAAYLSMSAFRLAAEELEPVLSRMSSQFDDLGSAVASGGLASGLDYLGNSLSGFADTFATGMAGIGAEIGGAARQLGDLASSQPMLTQLEDVFIGLRPIVRDLSSGMIALGEAMLNLLQGAIPMTQEMSAGFLRMSTSLRDWTAEQLDSGRMAEWLSASWDALRRAGSVLADLSVGLFNIFRIGAGYAGDLGLSVEASAASFREWTASAEGVQQISGYFEASLPALQEMGLLLGMMAGGLASLATNQNVAPLLEQIRTEFAPALGDLVNNLAGQDGLGPALISAATGIVQLIAAIDFTALTLFVAAVGSVASGVGTLVTEIPALGVIVSGLLTAFLGFRLLGPIFGLVAGGATAFSWVSGVVSGSKDMTSAQRNLRTAVNLTSKTFSRAGRTIVVALRAIGMAAMTNPLILAIGLAVAAIVFLWMNFEEFRDIVVAVWDAVASAAVTAWDWIVDTVTSAGSAIADIAMSIWTNGIKPAWDFIVAGASLVWDIISGIVQTAVYIIVAIVAGLSWIIEGVWTGISTAAQWAWDLISTGLSNLWNFFLLPIFQTIGMVAGAIWSGISSAAQWAWDAISAAASWLWNTILSPIFSQISEIGSSIWSTISGAASAAWEGITGAASAAWEGLQSVWGSLAEWFGGIWESVGEVASGVWEGISSAASAAGDVVKGVWDAITGAISGAWNFIADGWNSIPSITVPDWVPGIGGNQFSLPRLPTLWHGGEAPGGRAIVGEHGPEPLIRGGQLLGMVGMNGPEVASIPSGGYVVPNLRTLDAMPSLARSLPRSVASAVSRSVPGYAGALSSGGSDPGLRQAVVALADSVASRPPSVTVEGSGDVTKAVLEAWRKWKAEQNAKGKYDYTAGQG